MGPKSGDESRDNSHSFYVFPAPTPKFKYDFTDNVFLNQVLESNHNNHINNKLLKKAG